MKLKNKVAVITGGNSGIGFGIAAAFEKEGALGSIVGRKQAALDQSVASLGSNFIGINADVTKMKDLDRVFKDTSSKFGKIDTIVVNAGGVVEGAELGSIAVITESDFDRYMNLNLKSVYFTIQKALPYMRDGASIVLIGSIAGHRAFPGQTVYAAAKAAVISFARGISLDLLDRKIRVNVLSPGTIDTPVFGKFLPAEQVDPVKNMWVDLIPIGRIGQPSDIGNAAVFLASDESSFVVGTEIIADGGVLNMTILK
ncbi:SDR family oxidoreductase [Chitinophaga filiformis]|uniref:NAD(P)-dependent dehydrogenase, short-chain alcohol dehydrogenase family n=1 Tax=Chitinophaga filiformis TaxID=104663 RepID=A0A1G7RV49_CHIFI|nr:SDR family oxidoreductase [Chitinophaga filiformis]SDG14079.1 NAD(P)-dependent dehydrogenase, short-chain alcohol dehydrogenase family [Chitinophaga filiformis]